MFDHSSQANTGTRCCIFKTIYDNSTSASNLVIVEDSSRLAGCGVESLHTLTPISIVPNILKSRSWHISTSRSRRNAIDGSGKGRRLGVAARGAVGARDSQVLSYGVHHDRKSRIVDIRASPVHRQASTVSRMGVANL